MAKWPQEHEDLLRELWGKGLTGGEIAVRMPDLPATMGTPAKRVNRDMVIAKARRLGLEPRPSPLGKA